MPCESDAVEAVKAAPLAQSNESCRSFSRLRFVVLLMHRPPGKLGLVSRRRDVPSVDGGDGGGTCVANRWILLNARASSARIGTKSLHNRSRVSSNDEWSM